MTSDKAHFISSLLVCLSQLRFVSRSLHVCFSNCSWFFLSCLFLLRLFGVIFVCLKRTDVAPYTRYITLRPDQINNVNADSLT